MKAVLTRFKLFILILISVSSLHSRKCFDYQLTDGSEPPVAWGMDTTKNIWIITQAFSNKYRLIVNNMETDVYDQFTQPVFSPDGNRWACFAKYNAAWYLLANDTTFPLAGTRNGEVAFSADSRHMAYSYFSNTVETIVFRGRKFDVTNRAKKFHINQNGTRLAFTLRRGDSYTVYINGVESTQYDEIIPIGFWYNGEYVFAARNGPVWQIYRNDESISDVYDDIMEVKMNLAGDVLAFTAVLSSKKQVCTMISDEYWEPLVSRPYDAVYGIALHPELPLYAFKALYDGNNYIVINSTEYYGGEFASDPFFSYDGSEVYYIGCNIDCFVSISGRQYTTHGDLSTSGNYAVEPFSKTMAYATTASMMVRDLETQELYAGAMMDEVMQPRYNWRTGEFETIGRISNRLYLMTCEPP